MLNQIVQLYPHDESGSYQPQFYHRVGSLSRIWADEPDWSAPTLDVLHPDFAQIALACDVLVIHTLTGAEIEALIRLRRAHGKPSVYEIPDNYLALAGYLPENSLGHSPLVRQNMLYYAWLCDGLQVSSPALAQLLERVNPNLVVMDNYVPIPAQLPDKPRGFVFGWGGTLQHQPDLEPIAPVVAAFCRRYPDAIFAFKGYPEVYQQCFGDIPVGQSRFEPFGSYAEFQAFLQDLHVGLAPLVDTPVNRCRTDVKFAEYAAQGVAAVLADTPVYRHHAEHARLFASPAELAGILDELYNDHKQVDELARRAYSWLKVQRSASALGAKRREFYQALPRSKDRVSHVGVPPEYTELCAQLAKAWRARSEKLYEESLAICERLLRSRPDYPQAQYLYALDLETLGRAAEALEFIERQDVSPVFQDSFTEIQIRIARKICPAEMDRYVRSIQSPLYKLRWQSAGVTDRSSFYREVLRLQPFDYFVLMALIHLMTKDSPGDPQLAELRERAGMVAPDLVPREWLPLSLQPLLGKN